MKFNFALPSWRKSTFCALTVVALAALNCTTLNAGEPKLKHTKDSLDKVKKLLKEDKAFLVDVREKAEWDAGHVEGAFFVPLSDLSKNRADADYVKALNKELSKKIPLYVHCRSGHRSLIASGILRELGYDVRPLKPGFQALIDAGFPRAKTEKN